MAISSVLITGGAGFVGSHVASELLCRGYRVRVLDVVAPQVQLAREIELHVGDVRDAAAVDRALAGVDAVFHLAAAASDGRSMQDVERCTSVNNVGTAVLAERMVGRRIQRLVLASSKSVYGEGLFADGAGEAHEGKSRLFADLRRGEWEVLARDGTRLLPRPTPESKSVALESIDALCKYDQERLCLLAGRAHGIPTVVLRIFNAYGPRQALGDGRTTGALPAMASRILEGKPPQLFEDGAQLRDFVDVRDVARAFHLALVRDEAAGLVFNIGSGVPRSIREVAERVAALLGQPHLHPEITGTYRAGDVRHCYADISLARRVLGYEPAVDLDEGLAEWLRGPIARGAAPPHAEPREPSAALELTL
ncbi:MAG: NAD-dependent epimerase/dehydratase family protein [Labilithrix sp.]|nr:NAD-dependent epimerase/dehydratase family protein [Labilithrix sp.]